MADRDRQDRHSRRETLSCSAATPNCRRNTADSFSRNVYRKIGKRATCFAQRAQRLVCMLTLFARRDKPLLHDVDLKTRNLCLPMSILRDYRSALRQLLALQPE